MASPPARNSTNFMHRVRRVRSSKPPLAIRRLGAWTLEVTLVVASAFVPWSVGEYVRVQETQKAVPLNPILAVTQEAIAQSLGTPRSELTRQVPPLTNLFWTGALIAPILVGGWQLYLLASTGKTSPKRWLGVKVIAANTQPPGIFRVIIREGIGRWGVPVGTAYLIWHSSGAFPALGVLWGITGFALLLEAVSGWFDRHYRSFHDRMAGTYVLSEGRGKGTIYPPAYQIPKDAESVTAIVLVSQPHSEPRNLWHWMTEHPGLTLLIASSGALASVLATFIATQVYLERQTNRRELQQQDNQVYLQLVDQLKSNSPSVRLGRQEVILALGTLDDPRTSEFLVNLLSQETNLSTMNAIQQALVSSGVKSLPYLQQLNQTIRNDLESLQPLGQTPDRELMELRLRVTKQAIAKILALSNPPAQNIDLSRVQLGFTNPPIPFTLILQRADLAGIRWRGAVLTRANLQGSRFVGAGTDERWNTFDDAIADLSGADFKEANLTGTLLTRSLLNRTSFLRATLNQANLDGSQLNGSNLSSAQLMNASLQKAALEKASLTGADLTSANLNQANLQGSRLAELKAIGVDATSANFTNTEALGANFSEANLRGAIFRNADLSTTQFVGANLSNAQFQNANLRDADLRFADLRGANLAGTDLRGVIFVSSKPPKTGQFVKKTLVNERSPLLQGVDFSQAKNLEADQLRYICSQGGKHPQCRR